MRFYCIWQFFIFLTVIWLIDAKSQAADEQTQIKTNMDYTVSYHNYAKDQEIMTTEMEPQASEVKNFELRARRGNRKYRHIIHLIPQRKRGFVRHQNPKKYSNKHNYNKKNNNNNVHEEIIRTYEETHEHVEESSNNPQTYENENRATENYLNNAVDQHHHQQQLHKQINENDKLQQEQQPQQQQQQERHDRQALIDTQMEETQHHHHHHMTHEEGEDEIKDEKYEKIKIKHHHHHHHHNHVKEIIKKVAEPYPVEKIVRIPMEKIVEKIVHVPKPYPVEKIVHVPVEKIIEKIVHVPKPYPVEKIVEKKIPYTVEKIIEKIIHVPKPYPVEKIVNKVVHVPKPYPVIRPVPYAVSVPFKVEVEKKIPVPFRVEVEKRIPVYMKHSGHYEHELEEQQQQHRHEQAQVQADHVREEDVEEQQHEQRQHEEEQRDQYGYGSEIRGQETIYGKPQTMSQIYAQLQQQNAQTKSAIRDILIKQQLKNLGYQKIPTETQQESKNNYVMLAPQPSTFKIHVESDQSQPQKGNDLQPEASNMHHQQQQNLQPLTMPYQLFHIQAMPFQQPLGFSLPIKS